MPKIFFLIYLISFINSKGPYKTEEDILVLSEKTFNYALQEFKYITVLFYSPEDPHSKEFMNEYHKTASLLKNENFIFAKIDCIKYERIKNIYEIKLYPSLILIKGEEKIIYEGNKAYEDIKKWLEEKTRPKLIQINNKKELDNFVKNKLCMVYFGNNETTINELIIAERKFESMPLGIVSNGDLIKSESPKDKKNPNKEFKEYINIYKTFDDKKNTLKGILSSKNIYKFVYTYSYPKVIEFTDETSSIILEKRHPALIVFACKSGRERNPKDYQDSINLLKYMWPRIKDKIRLFVCDIKGVIASQIAKKCNVDMNSIPKVYIIHSEGINLRKYEMTGGINEENIMYFINQFKKGKLTPYIRSESSPKNKNKDVIKLVGKTFKKEVLENDKDILVYFVSPSCNECKEFEPELIKLSQKLKKVNNKLVIATIDATLNDVENLQIHNFPTIMFYPGNVKDEEPLEIKERDIESIETFIIKNSYNKNIEEEINQDL